MIPSEAAPLFRVSQGCTEHLKDVTVCASSNVQSNFFKFIVCNAR